MKRIASDSQAVAAAWAISSPEAVARGLELPASPGWKELSGKDTWVYCRLTRQAARVLAEQLLHAADSTEDEHREVLIGRPQGAWLDEVSMDDSGIFLHPLSASLTFRITEIPDIDQLMADRPDAATLLSPVQGHRCHFPEHK